MPQGPAGQQPEPGGVGGNRNPAPAPGGVENVGPGQQVVPRDERPITRDPLTGTSGADRGVAPAPGSSGGSLDRGSVS